MLADVAGRLHPRTAWKAVRLALANQPPRLRLWLGFLGFLMLIGAAGAIVALRPGAKLFGTTATAEWGLLIAAYVFFAVTTSGLCLASSLGTVFGIEMFMPLEKRHAILAVLFLGTAFGVIALDLHYPLRLAFGVVLSPSPFSPMWWMGVLYGIYLGFLLTEVWSMFTGHPRIHRLACVLSSIMAILAPSTLGAVFGVMVSRPFWHGAFTPAYLLLSALLSGAAVLGIVFYLVDRFGLPGHGLEAGRAIAAVRILLGIALGIALFLVTWQTIVGLYGGVPGAAEATQALLVGPLAPAFWLAKVGLGLLVPLVLLALPRTRTPIGLFVASGCALAGIFVDRLVFVMAGQIAPATSVSGVVSQPLAAYAPSVVEVAIVVGALGVVAFVYTLAERFLDLSGHVGHGRATLAPGLEPGGPGPAPDLEPGVPATEATRATIADSAGGAL